MSNFPLAVVQKAKNNGWELLVDNDQWTNRIGIYGSTGNQYIVAQNKKNKNWSCGCLGFRRHRHCKHLSAMGETLKLLSEN